MDEPVNHLSCFLDAAIASLQESMSAHWLAGHWLDGRWLVGPLVPLSC